jgi:uncharacterized protein (DUF4415 family)
MPKGSKSSARPTTPTQGRADLARLRRLSDAEIARSAPAELRDFPADFWTEARVVMPVTKEAISIRLDTDVIAYFRATGPKYQTRINAVLRSYVDRVRETARPARRKRAV